MKDSILIFRTSVARKKDIKRIGALFSQYPRIHKWSVDFEDWEKVLRIECRGMTPDEVLEALLGIGICAAELE